MTQAKRGVWTAPWRIRDGGWVLVAIDSEGYRVGKLSIPAGDDPQPYVDPLRSMPGLGAGRSGNSGLHLVN